MAGEILGRKAMGGLSVRAAIGLLFLAAQVVAVGWQHTGPSRYFTWAPNDYVVQYTIKVSHDGRDLKADEVARRYLRLYGAQVGDHSATELVGVYENPPADLITLLRQYEQTYGRAAQAQVTLTYTLNGRVKRTWRWPEGT